MWHSREAGDQECLRLVLSISPQQAEPEISNKQAIKWMLQDPRTEHWDDFVSKEEHNGRREALSELLGGCEENLSKSRAFTQQRTWYLKKYGCPRGLQNERMTTFHLDYLSQWWPDLICPGTSGHDSSDAHTGPVYLNPNLPYLRDLLR